MAKLKMHGDAVPIAVNLRIDEGNKPGGTLSVANGSRRFDIEFDFEELQRISLFFTADSRFYVDTKKWTKKDREQFDGDLEAFMKGNGL